MLKDNTIRPISENLSHTATVDTVLLLQPKEFWDSTVIDNAQNRPNILDKILIEADNVSGNFEIGFGWFVLSDTINPLLANNTAKYQFIKNAYIEPLEVDASVLTDLDNYKTIFSKGSDNVYRTYIDVVQMSQREIFGAYVLLKAGASIVNMRISIISA